MLLGVSRRSFSGGNTLMMSENAIPPEPASPSDQGIATGGKLPDRVTAR
jgi:hypothetical protein